MCNKIRKRNFYQIHFSSPYISYWSTDKKANTIISPGACDVQQNTEVKLFKQAIFTFRDSAWVGCGKRKIE